MNLGIICEFNPFHKGHRHLIDSVKNDGDGIICCMSGNFVQRGEPAVYEKFSRAKTAVENGADLVIELPTLCSTQSAQGFAKAGVTILESTGICDMLCFGAENADTSALKSIAQEIKQRDSEIKEELKKGISYPAARRNVLGSHLLDSPNNILAIEYLTYAAIPCHAVERIGKGHDSDDEIFSASQIRKGLSIEEIHSLKNCEKAILYKLRSMSADDFANIEDVSEGLENRILRAVQTGTNTEEIYDLIKTKRYTHSRIRRIILRSFLGITKDMPKEPKYIRVLAFNKKGQEMLAEMKKKATLPIITKYSDCGEDTKPLFETECKFTDIYNLTSVTPLPCGEEQRKKVIML